MKGKTARLLSSVAIAITSFSDIDRAQARNATILPPYSKIAHFSLTIAADGDLADVYFPEMLPGRSHTDELPIARWSGAFLRAAMLNDRRALDYVLSVGDGLDPNVTVTR
jgi:hypothetical protein